MCKRYCVFMYGFTIVMDNAAFHIKQKLYYQAGFTETNIIFLPPYSPVLLRSVFHIKQCVVTQRLLQGHRVIACQSSQFLVRKITVVFQNFH